MAPAAGLFAPQTTPHTDRALVTMAVLGAARRLGVSNKELARILGVSAASVSRMGTAASVLYPERKPYELALLFVRLYRALDSMVGGDASVAQAWLRAENSALGGGPLVRIMCITGLVETITYLEAHRLH